MPADIFGHTETPSGAITYLHDSPSNIPEGWVICDGNNGTPDMRDRFIKGTKDLSSSSGSTGGQKQLTLSTSQIDNHRHEIDNTGSVGDHNHYATYYDDIEEPYDGGYDIDGIDSGTGNGITSYNGGGHSHQINDDNTGSGNSIDNQPLYYELVPIMKI